MTRSKRLRVLAEVYAKIPEVGCKGLCWETCTSVPVFQLEREQLETKSGAKLEMVSPVELKNATLTGQPGAACQFLVLRRCTVYEARPLICRVFGAAEGLPCPHGCTPARIVPDTEVFSMLERVEAL
jgi:Fe-S-cluster containining protein